MADLDKEFAKFDTNNDGSISYHELESQVSSGHLDPPNLKKNLYNN